MAMSEMDAVRLVSEYRCVGMVMMMTM